MFRAFRLTLLLLLVSASASAAFAQPFPGKASIAFPIKPIRIIVPFGAGGIADLTARTVAQKLGPPWASPW